MRSSVTPAPTSHVPFALEGVQLGSSLVEGT